MELYTAAQMREIDRRAIEERGIPSTQLMENAARALANVVLTRALPKGPRAGTPSAVVYCGAGNNGGDGVAAARLLLEAGWHVKCVLVGDRTKMTPDCREMERRLNAAGGRLEEFNPQDREAYLGFDAAVDAMFGVGLNSPLRPAAQKAAEWMGMIRWTAAADVPSGIHADTGEVLGDGPCAAVRADVTVTFSRGKPGLYAGRGARHSGEVIVADIGIPSELYRGMDCAARISNPEEFRLPRRPRDSHKGDYGRLFLLAGSQGYTGAAALCARAAVRSGAGLVTLAVPEDIYPALAAKCCDEAMVWPMPEDDGAVLDKARRASAVVIGPGLGQGERAERLVLTLMRELTCPIVLDADGLNIISRHIDVLDHRAGDTLLTPHDGEFARLSGCELPIRDRLGAARAFAMAHRCTLVLKGCRTVTACPNGDCVINCTGNPGMAKGGCGDVLAGLLGAMTAQGRYGLPAQGAVWLHGRAGDLAAADKGEYGMTPSDLIERIPYAIKELMNNKEELK